MPKMIQKLLVTLFFVLSTQIVLAQPPGMPSAPDQAPIDGGLLVLAGGGAAYAIKKLKKTK